MNLISSKTVAMLLLGSLILAPQLAWTEEPDPAVPWDAAAPFTVEPQALLDAAAALPEVDAEVQILLRERIVRYAEDGSRVNEHRMIFRVLTAAGVDGWAYEDVLPVFRRSERFADGSNRYHGEKGALDVEPLRYRNALTGIFLHAAEQAGYEHNADFNGATQEGVGVYHVTHRRGALETPGVVSGVFFIGYALARSSAELFRQYDPDHAFSTGLLTPGIAYSIPMILIGAWLIRSAYAKRAATLET